MLTTLLYFVTASSGTQHCMNHLLTYFKKESETLKRWWSSTVAKRGPRKERECWCHFLGWVSKGFFPTFFKKWKYICSLEPVDHKTSNHAFLIPETGKRRLLRCFKILTALLNNICHKNLISKWIQILYFSLLSKTCKEIAFCEFLFHMVLVPLDFESLLPFCAMAYRTPWTLESCCFLLISRGEQILCFMGPKTIHIFQ